MPTMPLISHTPFWRRYGEDVRTLAQYLHARDTSNAVIYGLVRKYPRLVEMAALCDVELPEAAAEWACYFDVNAIFFRRSIARIYALPIKPSLNSKADARERQF